MIVQLFSCKTVDMGEQEIEEILIKRVKGCTFGKDAADQAVSVLAGTFFIRGGRITVEDTDTILFNSLRIREFRTVVENPYLPPFLPSTVSPSRMAVSGCSAR